MNRPIYAEAIADDIYSTIFKDDPLNSKCGGHFWKIVLHPGGSQGSYPLNVIIIPYITVTTLSKANDFCYLETPWAPTKTVWRHFQEEDQQID
jgi:hypothetical protein